MTSRWLRRGSMLLLCGWLATSAASAADRPAGQILQEINSVKMPDAEGLDRSDRQAVQQFIVKRQAAMAEKAQLIGELYKAYPETPELVTLLPERWQARMMPAKVADETKAEVEAILAKSKNEKLLTEAGFAKVLMAFQKAGRNPNPDVLGPIADEFLKRSPKDPRGAMILFELAGMTTDAAKKTALQDRLLKGYPDSPAVPAVKLERRRNEAIGKPFEISFVDAIKGTEVSSKTLKGKVVVVDFWATWCGPCLREMPTMKKLYAEYKDKGVEFVGVSLDAPKEQGGHDKLKDYVAKNKIEWPQYYQGNGWDSEFSSSWGIQAIPCVFIVGADGNLASVEAGGKLETLIPELLKKANKDEAKP